MPTFPEICTNYYDSKQKFKISNLILEPLVTLMGRKVKITYNTEGQQVFTVKVNKVRSVAACIFALLGTIVLSPAIALALIGRKFSNQLQKDVKSEKEFFVNLQEQEVQAFQKRQELERKVDAQILASQHFEPVKGDIQSHISLLCNLSSSVVEIQSVLPEKAHSLFKEFENHFNFLMNSEKLKNKELSFEELRELKRFLSRLIVDQKKINLVEWKTFSFKSYHQQIRTFYYENFTLDHMIANLSEKGRIPAIYLSLENLNPLGEENKEVIEGIREAFQDQTINPSQVTWIHGTTSSTIVGVLQTNGFLKPGGHLAKEGKVAFAGEHHQGAGGISQKYVSGFSLKDSKSAIHYATGGIGYNDKLGKDCTQDPKAAVEYYLNWLDKLDLEKDVEGKNLDGDKKERLNKVKEWIWNLREKYTDPDALYQNLANFHRHMRILCSLEPELFEEKIIPRIHTLIATINQIIAEEFLEEEDQDMKEAWIETCRTLRDEMFAPILHFKEACNLYAQEERELIQESYPVILGSTKLKLVEGKKSERGKTAEKIDTSLNEYIHEGPLRLGEDLPYIFVPQNQVQRTRDYLHSHGEHNVKVGNLAALILATSYLNFKKSKLRTHIM